MKLSKKEKEAEIDELEFKKRLTIAAQQTYQACYEELWRNRNPNREEVIDVVMDRIESVSVLSVRDSLRFRAMPGRQRRMLVGKVY